MKNKPSNMPAMPVVPANSGPTAFTPPSAVADYGMRAAERQLKKQQNSESDVPPDRRATHEG